MTQLSYNEAFDPYHAIFRYLRLYFGCNLQEPVPFDKFRILDFYLLYPFRLQNLQLYSDDTSWRSVSKSYTRLKPYGELPDDNSLFDRMAPFQKTAAESMARAGIICEKAWERNQILFSGAEIGTEVESRCTELNSTMADFISILCQINHRYDPYGRDGLKARSKLLEYRYDPI
ncbi:ABC-three component system middle component 5 [Ensifer sp. R-19]|uniref:ABC-three component system middle component 5 n=1 Tax=Ensifer sp. R-19 TaxID=3404055 RepID=UPI003CEBB7B0